MKTTVGQQAARPVTLRWGQVFSRRRFGERILPRIILVVMCLLFVTPFYWMVSTALKTNQELSSFPPTLWPHSLVWSNFSDAVNYIPFGTFFVNSLIITAGMTLGALVSNPLIAYGFSRIEWPGRDILFYIALGTIFIPFPVLMIALFDIFAKLHWINTYLPLIVPTFFGNPFYIFLMRQFFLQLPSEISDAARVDGANELQIFSRVILPLAKPALVVVAIFAAVGAWNEFLTPLIYLQSQDKYPLAIGLQFFRSTHDVSYALLMAASTLVVLPVLAAFLVFQRYFIEGITVGSVKG